jgi:hypothetical protein
MSYDKQNEEESGSDSEPELDEIDFKVKISTIFDKKYNHECRSFAKDTLHNVPLHSNHITFGDQPRKHLEKPEADQL